MPDSLPPIDMRLLSYFAAVAREGSLRRAAQRLFVSQPPLSRAIKELEDALGVRLFTRHAKGLVMTCEGEKALAAVLPLLAEHADVSRRLRDLARAEKRTVTVGLTTAVEQGVFFALEQALQELLGERLCLLRTSSPKLAKAVNAGTADAAIVALPLVLRGLSVLPLPHEEPFVAVLPRAWPQAQQEELSLRELNGLPVFWFRPDANPAFYELSARVFARAGFAPVRKDEPAGHDVLLARVAAGEAGALLPESFTVVRRNAVAYVRLRTQDALSLRLGFLARQDLAEKDALLEAARLTLHPVRTSLRGEDATAPPSLLPPG